MSKKSKDNGSKNISNIILAAGGLLWKKVPEGFQIALVHRPKHNDWTLPKGKIDPEDSSLLDTAIREVREETGCEVIVSDFADEIKYEVNKGTKFVLYWHMRLESENAYRIEKEVDEVKWLSYNSAIKKLSYSLEKGVLKRNAPDNNFIIT